MGAFRAGNVAAVSAPGELKVYRPPRATRVLVWVLGVFCLFLGLSIATAGGREPYVVVNAVLGAFFVLYSLLIAEVAARTRLIVRTDGLLDCYILRRRAVSWAEVQSFRVGRTQNRVAANWPAVVICRKDGSTLVTHITGFTRKYPAFIVDELTAWQQQLAPATLGQLP